MNSRPFALAILATMLTSACMAQNVTITFDDLPTPVIDDTDGDGDVDVYDGSVTNGYNGLTWDNFGVASAAEPHFSGYYAGTISPTNVAFNGNGNPADFYGTNQFRLVSAYLTAAWNDDLQLEVLGYLNGTVVYNNIYYLSSTSPTLINFNNAVVNDVSFQSSGGSHNPNYDEYGEQFALDNLTILFLTGFLYFAFEIG